MADINVERKKPSMWPWVIGLVVLAVLIWVVVEVFRGSDVTTTGTGSDTTVVETAPPATPPPPPPAAVQDTTRAISDPAVP